MDLAAPGVDIGWYGLFEGCEADGDDIGEYGAFEGVEADDGDWGWYGMFDDLEATGVNVGWYGWSVEVVQLVPPAEVPIDICDIGDEPIVVVFLPLHLGFEHFCEGVFEATGVGKG